MGNSFPNNNISHSYNSSSLPTAYQGLWATVPPTTTSATAAARCPRPIRRCGQLFPQRRHQLQLEQQLFAHGLSGAVGNSSPQRQHQHQLQHQLFAHGLSGAVGNSSPNDNISYSSSSLPTAYQGLWATLSPTTTSATATTAALCPRPIRGCGQLFPQRQHQLQQQLFAHGLSGAVGNSFPNDNISYSSSSLPTAYQGLWATLSPTTTSATAAALCPRPIRGCGQLFPQRQHQLQQQLFAHGLSGAVGHSSPQRQHQLQQQLFAHGLSGAVGNSFPNDNISYSSSSLPTAYQGLWATLPPTTTSATAAALCPRPIRGCGQFFPQRHHQLQQQLFAHSLSGAVGNSSPNDNISYSSSSLPTAYQGLWAILPPNDNISYSSSSLPTAYQGLWATVPPTTTSATAAALCPRPIRGCGQLFPQRQHQLQQQLFAHGLSGAVGNSFPNDNISYSSSSLSTAYQGLWATLSPTTTSATAAALCPRPIRGCGKFFPPTTTSATAAALCPRPIRGCGQLFPPRQHQLQQQLFVHGLSGAVGNSFPNDNISYSSSSLPTAYQGLWATLPPTTTSATAAALCPRPIRGCGQLFPQRQHQLQLQQQLFAHGLSGAVGNSSPNDNTSYSSSSLPTAYQGLWATLSPTTTSATAAALCPRPIRGCGQLFPQRQHQLQQQLFAHGLSGAVGNSSPNDNISYSSSSLPTAYQGLWAILPPNDNISYSSSSLPTAYQGLWATLSPTITSATAAALCPRPIRGCGQLFPQRQHQLQQQLFAHGLSGAVGNSFPNDIISYSSSSLPTAYQGLWATLPPTTTSATAAALCPRPIRGCGPFFPPTTTSATAAALCPRPIRGCGQLFPQRQHQLQQQLFAHGLSGAVGNSSPNDNISYSSSSLPTAYQGLWAILSPTTTSATAAALCPRPIRGCGQLFPPRQHQLQQQLFVHGLSGAVGNFFPQRQHQLQQQLFVHGLSGAVGNSFPHDNISYSSSSLSTAYQGLWAILSPTTTSATAAALCPRPIRGCGQLFPQQQHQLQLQQQLFAHGLSGAVGNCSPNDNISYSSSSLPTAYQALWATLPPTTTSATAAALCPRPIRRCGQLFPQRQHQLQQQLFVHGLSGAVGNSSPNDNISYSSSSLPTAYQGLWATLPPTTTSVTAAALCPRPISRCGQLFPQRRHQLQQQLFVHGLSGAVGNSSPNDNISYSSSFLPTAYQGLWAILPPNDNISISYNSSSLPTAYQGLWAILPPNDNTSYNSSSLPTAYQALWATLPPTTTSATAAAFCPRPIRGCGQFFPPTTTSASATTAALCPRPIRGCGQLFPQRQHQLQQQLFAHGLSGAVGNSFPNDNITYSSSSLSRAYQGLWATLSPTTTSATVAALCPRPIRGCGQFFPQRQHQLQQQLFAHGLSGAVGNSFPNNNISYSYNSSSLPTAYQGLWATVPPTTTSATATAAALCPRPIRGCGQLFPQRQHQLQQQLFAHGLSGAVGNSSPNDNTSYSSSSLSTAYQGLWATVPPTTTSATATAAALCPRPIRGCGQLFPQRQNQLQQQLFAHGLSGAVGNCSPNNNISYSYNSSSLPTAYQGLWAILPPNDNISISYNSSSLPTAYQGLSATLPPTTTSATATTSALCPRPIRRCGQLFPQRQHQLQQQLFAHGLSGAVGNSFPNDNISYSSSSLPTAYQGLWAILSPTTTSATAAALCPRPIRGCGQLFPQR